MFHQIEGLVVDEHITMADLKGTLLAFIQEMFGEDVRLRLRPELLPIYRAERRSGYFLRELRR